MRDPDVFDAFYAEARGRLLLQTYALTGDLPASRDAVRSAFVTAWHHWRKVGALDDPESWVRPQAWRRAQRRHQARPWHRERLLDDDSRATLDALGSLTVQQRKTLLLTQLSSATTSGMAREVGLTDEIAAAELQTATSQLCLSLGIVPAEIRPTLEALAERLAETRFPRASIVRRTGAARRRLHTTVGVAVSIATLLGTGALVYDADELPPLLGSQSDTTQTAPQEPRLQRADLLNSDELDAALAPRRTKGSGSVDNNTGGTGIYAPCQAHPFAVSGGEAQALVRRMKVAGSPKQSTVQSVESAPDTESAHTGYLRMQQWFTECRTPRVQLLSVYRLDGVGDEGMVLTLRSWDDPVTTHQAAVVRSGRLLSLVLLQRQNRADPKVAPMLDLASSAVRRLCGSEFASPDAACVVDPEAVRIPPPPARTAIGMLQVIDLPPVPGVPLPWVGVKPVKPATNPAATRCDKASFTGKGIKKGRTRTFVIPGADVPTEFGLTETMGTFRSQSAARAFVAQIRKRVNACAEDDLTTTVRQLGEHTAGREELTSWRIDTEVSDTRSLTQLMAVVRRGRVVAQVSFTPGSDKSLAAGGFDALAMRALKRITNLPEG